MTLEERIKSFARMCAAMLAQLEELRALQEQIRQVQEAILERQQVVQRTIPPQK